MTPDTPRTDTHTPPSPPAWSDERIANAVGDLDAQSPAEPDLTPLEAALADRSESGRTQATRSFQLTPSSQRWNPPSIALAALVALVALSTLTLLILPTTGTARRTAASATATESGAAGSAAVESAATALPTATQSGPARELAIDTTATPGDLLRSESAEIAQHTTAAFAPAPAAPRLVIRDAEISIRVDDVQDLVDAIDAIRRQVRPEAGEFIESITRTAPHRARLILKIDSPRLPAALDATRTLGDVVNESASGRDVTDQAIDLAARIRNAQRVETQLLELLDNQPDAPLRDVLTVQRELDAARERIERLIASRDTLLNRAALATLTVNITANPNPAADPDNTFPARLRDAFDAGFTALQNTIAFLIRVIVGGAIFWIMLIVGITLLVRQHRRNQRLGF